MQVDFTDEEIADIKREFQLRRVLISSGMDTPRLYDKVFYKLLVANEKDKKNKENV